MSWEIALAAGSFIAGSFNAYDEYHANREIREDLEKIKKYLLRLDAKADAIIVQNKAILMALDELPELFREILQDVQSEGMLAERYTTCRNIKDNFILLQGGRRYRLRSEEWLSFSEAMSYLFEHEYRPSKTFSLIGVCEIALVITKERSLPFVLHHVNKKIQETRELSEDVVYTLEERLVVLKSKLNNSKFIKSHNLNTNLGDFNDLSYEKSPDRQVKQYYKEKVCEWVWVPGPYADRRVKKCRDEKRSRMVPDKKFHGARDKFVAGIEGEIREIKVIIDRVHQLNAIAHSYEVYLMRIEQNSKILSHPVFESEANAALQEGGNEYFTLPMYYEFEEGGEKIDVNSIEQPAFDDYDDYIDGCHGDCDSIKGMDAEDNNESFESVKARCMH
ncbi:MAG: hypothetical protein ACFE0K_15530 [Alcanivorax sp.]|uniref:hypothetical protein n=1 Tax=Alcanivorax sp. TaxID=1872427 RepID=UPI003DA6EE07